MPDSSNGLHEAPAELSALTRDMHRALASLQEELEAVDWYRQRADACRDGELREVLLHNMREEIEHSAMVLEWLRRRDATFDEHLRTYLFTERPITEVEDAATASDSVPNASTATSTATGTATDNPATRRGAPPDGLTIGSMKHKSPKAHT